MADKKKKLMCPYTGLKKPCIEHDCPKWTKLITVNPQTGEEINEWACSDTWLPILLTEISHKLVQTEATIESHRNKAAQDAERLQQTITQAENIHIKINEEITKVLDAIRVEATRASGYQLGKSEREVKKLED